MFLRKKKKDIFARLEAFLGRLSFKVFEQIMVMINQLQFIASPAKQFELYGNYIYYLIFLKVS